MSQNNHPIIYAGLDIHKSTLQLHLAGSDLELPNSPSGLRKLLTLLTKHQNTHVICEASGGYERTPVAALHSVGIPVSVLNPAKVRHFARALGQRAKTDPLDARLLSSYGSAIHPSATPPKSVAERQLVELVRYRLQLMEKIVSERQQSEMLEHAVLARQSMALLKRMETDLAKVDALIAQLCEETCELKQKVECLTVIPGVGAQTAVALLAEMPELGTLNRRQAAALAGLAPHPRQSGQWIGKAVIGGGRPQVRRALYMAALSASRFHPALSAFYQRLCAKGKPAKVALTAVMRKLLVLVNLLLKSQAIESPNAVA
jgi:transposase